MRPGAGENAAGGPQPPQLSGFLNINKDRGITSTDVVRRVKRWTRSRKVGHAGTLDPDATGVLPICIGTATRFVEAVIEGGKAYSITVRLGASTDTYDATGRVTREGDPTLISSVSREKVEAVLSRFRGDIEQVPPMYSALKLGGRPLYEIARSGETVERAPRKVKVRRLDLAGWAHPDFVLEVECGRGFYARSLAHDLGEALGCGAHMLALIRRSAGPFRIEDAVTLADLEGMVKLGNWADVLLPPDFVLGHLRKVVLDPLAEERLCHGQAVPARVEAGAEPHPGTLARMYSSEGRFLALARYEPTGPSWQPEKVVAVA